MLTKGLKWPYNYGKQQDLKLYDQGRHITTKQADSV